MCIGNDRDNVDSVSSDKNQHSTAVAADSDKAVTDKDASNVDDDDDELNLLNEEDVAKLGLMTVTLQQQKGE